MKGAAKFFSLKNQKNGVTLRRKQDEVGENIKLGFSSIETERSNGNVT